MGGDLGGWFCFPMGVLLIRVWGWRGTVPVMLPVQFSVLVLGGFGFVVWCGVRLLRFCDCWV